MVDFDLPAKLFKCQYSKYISAGARYVYSYSSTYYSHWNSRSSKTTPTRDHHLSHGSQVMRQAWCYGWSWSPREIPTMEFKSDDAFSHHMCSSSFVLLWRYQNISVIQGREILNPFGGSGSHWCNGWFWSSRKIINRILKQRCIFQLHVLVRTGSLGSCEHVDFQNLF